MTTAQINMRALEAEKMEQMKKLREQQKQAKLNPPVVKEEPKPLPVLPVVEKTLPSISSGLPSIGGRGGNFAMDADYLKKAKFELNKLNEIADFD